MTPTAAFVAGVCLVAAVACALRAAALGLSAVRRPLTARAEDELLGASVAAVAAALVLVVVIGV